MNENKSESEKLLDLGLVPVIGRIENETLTQVCKSLLALYLRRMEKITVLISSNGGSGDIALEIYDNIRLYPGEVTAIVVGKAMSAAVTILQACHKRLATPNSRILIHHGRGPEFNNDLLYDEVALGEFLKNGRSYRERIYQILCTRTKKTRKEVQNLCKEDKCLFVEDAIKFGLLDAAWNKPLPWNPVKGLSVE